MKSRLTLIALLLLMAAPVQGNGGFFLFGSDLGHVHSLGTVARGSRITVDIFALQTNLEFTCPIKVTFFMMRQNNFGQIQRMTFRRNATNSQVVVPSARFVGDAVLIIQNQNVDHVCLGSADVIVDTSNTFFRNRTSDDEGIASWGDDLPPEEAIPVDPSAAEGVELLYRSGR